MIKPGFIRMVILAGIIFSHTFSVAEQTDANSDPLVLKLNEISAAIEELNNKKDFSSRDLQLLLDLNKEKAVLDKKIEDLKLNNIDGRINFAVKSYGDMRARIKEIELAKEASAKEVSLKEALVNNPELQARILAKEFVLNKDPLDEQKADLAAVKAKNTQEIEARNKQTEDELTDVCFSCKAVANDNIKVCEEIRDENRRTSCHQFYMTLKLFGELNKHKQVTNAGLDVCKELFSNNKPAEDLDSSCKLICNTYLTRNVEPVINLNYFKGEDGAIGLVLLSGDTKYCNYGSGQSKKQATCLNYANLSAAIRSNNKELCSGIDNWELNTICQVYFDRDEKKCEDSMAAELSKRREKVEK